MKKLNKMNVNELLGRDNWYNLNVEDLSWFNKDGYYKIKCKEDSIIESVKYIGKEFNCEYDNILENVIGLKDGYEYIRI